MKADEQRVDDGFIHPRDTTTIPASDAGATNGLHAHVFDDGAPVPTASQCGVVWRALREAWITHRVVANTTPHVKGGYAWDAASYAPVFMVDEEGDPFLSFRRK